MNLQSQERLLYAVERLTQTGRAIWLQAPSSPFCFSCFAGGELIIFKLIRTTGIQPEEPPEPRMTVAYARNRSLIWFNEPYEWDRLERLLASAAVDNRQHEMMLGIAERKIISDFELWAGVGETSVGSNQERLTRALERLTELGQAKWFQQSSDPFSHFCSVNAEVISFELMYDEEPVPEPTPEPISILASARNLNWTWQPGSDEWERLLSLMESSEVSDQQFSRAFKAVGEKLISDLELLAE
jgi:hypothetical protein